jgi:hypothetical protein
MPFMDLIKKAIFEEEPQPQQAQQAPKPVASQPAQRTSEPTTAAHVPMATRDSQFYARLAKQTDLSAIPELARIETFAAPLAQVIQDKSLRYKAALATAQTQGGLTKAAILKGFDSLLEVLTSSATSFNKQTDDVAKTEVDAKLAGINDINESIQQKQKEIADLQEKARNLQSQAEVARAKLQEAKSNFVAALERRRAEIQQQRKEFETFLA